MTSSDVFAIFQIIQTRTGWPDDHKTRKIQKKCSITKWLRDEVEMTETAAPVEVGDREHVNVRVPLQDHASVRVLVPALVLELKLCSAVVLLNRGNPRHCMIWLPHFYSSGETNSSVFSILRTFWHRNEWNECNVILFSQQYFKGEFQGLNIFLS